MHEAILKRKSIRTYENTPLSANDLNTIKLIMKDVEALKGPFNHSISLRIHTERIVDSMHPVKIGTYGFVTGASVFISGKCHHSFYGLIDFGYLFEYLILKLTEQNLGTVWLGGTFNRKDFSVHIKPDELIPAITPVGYIKTSRTARDKLIRKRSKGDERLPIETLFYQDDFDHPMSSIDAKQHHIYSLIRFAPSASNKQPWRFLIKNHMMHLYYAKTPKYASFLNFDIQALDLGIAICHMVLAFKHAIDDAPLVFNDPLIKTDYTYIASLSLP